LFVDGAPDPREVDTKGYSFFSLHTILFVLACVVVDNKASSFGFHTGLFFFGGVGMAFGVFSFIARLTFFCFDFFLTSLFFFT
jgi:hypothetical protein